MVIDFKFLQSWNAYDSIDSTLSGIERLVRFSHFINSPRGILVIPSGSFIVSRHAQPSNALSEISLMSLGNTIFFRFLHLF